MILSRDVTTVMFSLCRTVVGSMETTGVVSACWILLVFAYVQRATAQNDVDVKKRQTEIVEDLNKNFGTNPKNKDVAEEAFSLEFSGDDYHTLVDLLLDARNQFVKLQVNGDKPSSFRSATLNETIPEVATGIGEEPVTDPSTDAESDSPLRSDVTEDIYFNPVTLDPFGSNVLAQTETLRDRKAKAHKLQEQVTKALGGVPVQEAVTPPYDAQSGGPEDALRSVTTCIPPPAYIPVAYQVPVDPYLYQPQYIQYGGPQDGYSYPPAQDRAADPQGGMPGSYMPGSDCLSYFCSQTVCTAWKCTSEPCTSGQCVAKECVGWSCDTWSNSPLTKVQNVDWVAQPDGARYYDPLSGL